MLCLVLPAELIREVEQVILEEFYEIEIEMHFKWKGPKIPALPPSSPRIVELSDDNDDDIDDDAIFYDAL